MMTQSKLDQLLGSLQAEHQLVQEFIGVLQTEQDVLIEGEAQVLADHSAIKSEWAERLAEAAALRGQHLEALGHSNDKEGLDEAARQHPELASSITALLDTARAAQALNASNGRLIEQFMSQNQETLDALQRLMGNGPLYDASGRSRRAGPANTVIKAG